MIEAYHRPSTLEQALDLLDSDHAAVLAGGTSLIAGDGPDAVVDLQDLGLDSIALDGDRLAVGAMTRLRDFAASDLVPQPLRQLAMREAPNTIRNAATIGGTVASGDPESELIAGHGGVFEVIVDGDLLFSKKSLGRFPDDGEVLALIRAR